MCANATSATKTDAGHTSTFASPGTPIRAPSTNRSPRSSSVRASVCGRSRRTRRDRTAWLPCQTPAGRAASARPSHGHDPQHGTGPQICTVNGGQMRKNYGQVRRQKELAKKVRQQEKQQRRTARLTTAAATEDPAAPEEEPATVAKPIVHDAS